jgi:hypothetical protein
MTEPTPPGEHLSDEELEEHRQVLDQAEEMARNVTPVPKLTRKQLREKLSQKENDGLR